MGKDFQVAREAAVDATPEQVWDAIATGAGIDSWFMGNTRVDAERTITTAFGGYRAAHPVLAWEPGERLAYEDRDPASGRFVAYEFLIAGRSGGGAVLRTVTSGFLPGDDWADEYEAMGYGLALFFDTLVAYLTHFTGRAARPVTAFGPAVTDWPATWAALHDRLGLTAPVAAGDRAHLTGPGGASTDAVVYHADPHTLGLRTAGALLRFLRGADGRLVAAHHLFDPTDHADTTADAAAWQAWLTATRS
ncbi:SRPBCC family protein [Spirilliplanes yamanashiensis]|uniref:Activator of Hsp90 ATPase homologue 1/2-like C-terminal domain-containing protein n=1 Tax=Spirilliplanes yamanashiensis TaxID=42233 RepID=A0A8J4DL52_9ACTN|nr:SRPBCC domain-containing protein [Spirilliplanes yamanashiensis]MDP9817900.1 uncharacterized protein YndB with AHSA1/START domain [Spirilliplanes yamanashiensis]GIJ04710.1 hypothetical protein Sya03_40620 [Spirilliplanes yamanashiensis]